VAVFIDGCFWHACPDHGVLPKNNREWWQNKLSRNVARDREKDVQLDAMGWVAVHIWEHENPIGAADTIERLWRSRRQPPPRRAGDTRKPHVV
jgi:DNA mismatch endonuclease (patch repair protein)